MKPEIILLSLEMTPEQRVRVLSDYNGKRFVSAAALAKAHGVSKSSVYRLLKVEGEPVSQPEIKEVQHSQEVPIDFFQRTEKFADDLGLPMTNATRHETEQMSPQEREEAEERADAVFSSILGGESSSSMPKGLLENIYGNGPGPLPLPLAGPLPVAGPKSYSTYQLPPSHNLSIQRGETIQKIIFNVEHFAPLLESLIGRDTSSFILSLVNRGDEELEGLLTLIERTRSVGNLASGFKQLFFAVAQGTELITQGIGMRTRGFSDQLRAQDEQITMCLKELAIEQWERLKGLDSPQIRLSMLFAMTLAQTDARNRMNEVLSSVSKAPVNPDVVINSEDL